ncbi:class I SAM-dependent methyltransferase [Falsiroseomonas sp.]|uniref:class I SAM-dependent methyltransferase n=1 Tax=Falsiroseomonas sp. TaxID=2870721 RepID=UPI00356ADD36
MEAKLEDRARRVADLTRELRSLSGEYQALELDTHRLEQVVMGLPVTRFRELPPEALRLNVGTRTTRANFLFQGHGSAALVRSVFGDDPGFPVLDWGCGSGRTLNWLHPVGSWARWWHGCDVDRAAIAWLNAQGIANARPCADEPPLPYEDGFFGQVFSFSVLTHIDPPKHPLWYAELRRVMRPGGRALLTVQGDAIIAAKRVTGAEHLAHYEAHGWVHVEREGHYKSASLISARLAQQMASEFFEIEDYQPGGYNKLMDRFIVRKPA